MDGHRTTDDFQSSARWELPAAALVGLTPVKARDLVVECFHFAQSETLARAKRRLGAGGVDDASIRTTVVGAIRATFHEVGGDYDAPTAPTLRAVVDLLAQRAEGWGTPAEVVRHHHQLIRAMLERLPG